MASSGSSWRWSRTRIVAQPTVLPRMKPGGEKPPPSTCASRTTRPSKLFTSHSARKRFTENALAKNGTSNIPELTRSAPARTPRAKELRWTVSFIERGESRPARGPIKLLKLYPVDRPLGNTSIPGIIVPSRRQRLQVSSGSVGRRLERRISTSEPVDGRYWPRSTRSSPSFAAPTPDLCTQERDSAWWKGVLAGRGRDSAWWKGVLAGKGRVLRRRKGVLERLEACLKSKSAVQQHTGRLPYALSAEFFSAASRKLC